MHTNEWKQVQEIKCPTCNHIFLASNELKINSCPKCGLQMNVCNNCMEFASLGTCLCKDCHMDIRVCYRGCRSAGCPPGVALNKSAKYARRCPECGSTMFVASKFYGLPKFKSIDRPMIDGYYAFECWVCGKISISPLCDECRIKEGLTKEVI